MPTTFTDMRYPILENIPNQNELLTQFAGYDHRMSCSEGFFYNERNVSSEHFPYLSSRKRRKTVNEIDNYLGAIGGKEAIWASGSKLYVAGDEVSGLTLDDKTFKTFVKMGAYTVIFPDKVWYNTNDKSYGNIEQTFTATSASVTFQQVNSKGENITLWNGVGDPPDGAYKIDTKDGKSVLKVYSATSKMWVNVATTYFKMSLTNIGKDFKKGDGVKIEIDFTGISWARAKDIFVNDEGNGKRSSNFAIYDRGDDYIIVIGLLDAASQTFTLPSVYVGRECPDITYVCECQNRLWGVNKDGHEIYACKLGDPTNWNCFAGISTDSWTATVGSEGKFTGAFAYMGNPIMFQEDRLYKINVSAYGAHSYRETTCRGVQCGCSKSLVQVNELLYYKSPQSVCVYDGNFPQEIGAEFGDIMYSEAVGGGWDSKYYLSMVDEDNKWHLFVYDTNNYLWSHEDNTQVLDFLTGDNRLFFSHYKDVDTVYIECVDGETYFTEGTEAVEKPVNWSAESGFIGYTKSDKLYLSRFAIRMKLGIGAECSMFIEYDSSGRWEYVWNLSGKGTKTFAIPVRPNRCDHFRYKLVGKGECTLIAVAKEYGEGSDM